MGVRLTLRPLTGYWYRAVNLKHWDSRLSSDHSRITRSRFSAGTASTPLYRIIYLGETHQVAIHEVRALLGDPSAPIANSRGSWAILSLNVILDQVVDLSEIAAAAKNAHVKTFVWYNYRRCPAVAMAHKMVKDGALGTIRHVRGFYLQDWADESIPLIWRFQKETAGSGSHGDLNAHVIDMTRFVTGEEITEISGAIVETFVKERTLVTGAAAGGIAAGVQAGAGTGPVTVDDAVLFLARFSGGAVASFEAARQATGNQNRNGFEINGAKGALKFDFERMNELQYYDATRPRAVQGWTTIMCTHGGDHPYAEHWWPDAHVLGYEHGFVNQAFDILQVLGGHEPTVPIPDFQDAYQTQRVLEAALISAAERRPVALEEVH